MLVNYGENKVGDREGRPLEAHPGAEDGGQDRRASVLHPTSHCVDAAL